MDRNQVTGFVLIAVILGIYLVWFAPEPQENAPNSTTTEISADSTATTTEPQLVAADTATIADSLIDSEKRQKYGVFAPFVEAGSREFVVSTNVGNYTFSTKGGMLQQVELTQHQTYSKEPLVLFDKSTHSEKLNFTLSNGNSLDINELTYATSGKNTTVSEQGDSVVVTFDVAVSSSQFIRKSYTLYNDRYDIGYGVQLSGLDKELGKSNPQLVITDNARHFEKDLKQSRYGSFIGYYLHDDEEYDNLGERSLGNDSEELPAIDWFSLKHKYFNKSYVARGGFEKAEISIVTDVSQQVFTKSYAVTTQLNYSTLTTNKNNFVLYFGPSDYSLLKKVGFELERNVYLGWYGFREINEYLILPLFNLLKGVSGNYGLIIFLLVLIIKMAIFPFTFKSFKGFAKMRVLKPELDELRDKYKDDQVKFQQEQMKVYQKFGVSPLSGCIPMLFQMPFLLALFQLFPNVFALRGQSFLWAEDLSTYDAFFTWQTEIPLLGNHISLFTLMMTLSTIAYTYISQQITPQATAPGQPNMKVISYMMPVIFFFVLNDYASGLTYYYFLSNLITIGQQLISKKFIDEEQILSKMREYSLKSNDKKKNSFTKRLEEAMKAQQANQKKK